MESLRKEIQDEMKRTRLDKDRLYNLLLKIVDGGVGGGEAVQGPAGPAGPAGECKCAKVETPTPASAPAPVAPKNTTVTKKSKTTA